MNRIRKKPEVHGHRGCRGYLPENTIPAFLRAVELGVDAIEMDVVVTGDKQILVSHEAWFSSEICLAPDGSSFSSSEETTHNIYKLSYNQIRQYDCGLRPHARFPKQTSLSACEPLLTDVIDAVEEFTRQHGYPAVKYNIEIKSHPEGDELYHPLPKVFADLLMQVLHTKGITQRTMVQSFDVRPLQQLHQQHEFKFLGLLVEDHVPVDQHLAELGFLPFAYNPEHRLLDDALVSYLNHRNISIFTWTVNAPDNVADILEFDIDGIITDYPSIVQNILSKYT